MYMSVCGSTCAKTVPAVHPGDDTLPKKTAYYMPYYMVYSYSMANSMANSLFNPNSLKTSQTVWQTETCLPNC